MKHRYHLYRQGKYLAVDALHPEDFVSYQGHYILDLGPDLCSRNYGMLVGGKIYTLSEDKFPNAFRTELLVRGAV